MRRKIDLCTGETYHIYTKSIYGYVIFPTEREYERMIQIMRYNLFKHNGPKFTEFIRSYQVKTTDFTTSLNNLHPTGKGGGLVEILAYCLMPTHIHLIARQTMDEGIRLFTQKTLNSYSQYFNRLHNRKGPLWQGRFGASLIRDDDQLEEKIAYVNNNPVKDLGYRRPEDWKYSSLDLLHPSR